MLAIHHLRILEPQRAVEQAEPALAEAQLSGSVFWVRVLASVTAAARMALGEPAMGLRVLDEVAPESTSMRSQGLRYCWWRRAEIMLRQGRPARALELADALIATAAPGPSPAPLPDLSLLRGDALLALHQPAAARLELRHGRERAGRLGQLHVAWRLDGSLGAAATALGDHSEAAASFGQARAMVDALATAFPDPGRGAAFRSRALALLDQRAGAQATPAAALGLTPRELEVLQLLAAGCSDRAIADALALSPRTISTHVNHIFTKLEVGSRAAAAASAVRLGLA
jgi:DNA-binding CsgD family transcriptional regulator